MYKRILVPLDGSQTAEIVLPYAEDIAARFGAKIVLVSVSDSGAADSVHLYSLYLERVKEQIQRRLKGRKTKREAKLRSVILQGKPADEILRYAADNNINLIVMASHGSSSRGPWSLGNIAGKVLRATESPVLLIRTPANKAVARQKRLVKKILVPLDGSEPGKAAIPHAEEMARVLSASLVFFQVLEPITGWAGADTSVPSQSGLEGKTKRKNLARDYLNDIVKPLKERGLKISTAVAFGSPADQILDYARAKSIDIIAMSTHGRSGIGRWVFGSVTDKVLHAGDAAVLVIRAAKT
jgi:nucleotide-binding universal stress UspA family protein